MNWILVVFAVILCSFSWSCQALRCRTEDGPSDDELKKIARICLKKVGENESNSYEDSRESNEDNNDHDYAMSNNKNNNFNQRNGNNYYNNNNYNGQSGYSPEYNRGNTSEPSSRDSIGYQNWNNFDGDNANNNYNWNRNQSYGNFQGNGDRANARRDNKKNQTEHDQACFVHCYFHELRLTNDDDDQPDKFKMLNVLTRSIRDVELKQFNIDSIQQCFRMIEHMDSYRRRNDKCDMAQAIANCLTERAKANCDDFADDVMIL